MWSLIFLILLLISSLHHIPRSCHSTFWFSLRILLLISFSFFSTSHFLHSCCPVLWNHHLGAPPVPIFHIRIIDTLMGSYRTRPATQYGLRKAVSSDTQYAWDDPSDEEDSPKYSPHPVLIKPKIKAHGSTKLEDKREKNRLKQRKYRARQANMIESLQKDNQALRSKNLALLENIRDLQELIDGLRKENQGSNVTSCAPTYSTDSGADTATPQRRLCGKRKSDGEQTHQGTYTDAAIEKDDGSRSWQAKTFPGNMDSSPSISISSSPLAPSKEFSSPHISFAYPPAESCPRSVPDNHFWTDSYELDDFQLYRSNHHDLLDRQLNYPVPVPVEESTIQTQSFPGWYSLASDQRSYDCSLNAMPGLVNRDPFPTPATSVSTLSGSSYAGNECESNEFTYTLPPQQIHSETSSNTLPAVARYPVEYKLSPNVLGLTQLDHNEKFEKVQRIEHIAGNGMPTTMSFGLTSPPVQNRTPASRPGKVGMLTRGRKQAGYRH